MSTLFYVSGIVAIVSAVMVITRTNAMHALVYLVLVFLATASVFLTLGAPFIAALQIVVYAGAIIVLFVFAVMMLDQGREAQRCERGRLRASIWLLPVVMTVVLLAQLIIALAGGDLGRAGEVIGPKAVGINLYTNYIIGVELASMLLLAALVAAFHFGLISDD